MARDQNTAAQQHLGELLNAGRIDDLGDVFAADVQDHDRAPGQGDGLEGTKSFFRTLTSAFPDAHLEVDRLVADEDDVVIAYRLTGTHQGEFQGVPATGRRIEVRGVQVGRFEDGKIVERWGATDELGILQQIGATVQPPADAGTGTGTSSARASSAPASGGSLADVAEEGPIMTDRQDRTSSDADAPLNVRDSEYEAQTASGAQGGATRSTD